MKDYRILGLVINTLAGYTLVTFYDVSIIAALIIILSVSIGGVLRGQCDARGITLVDIAERLT